MSGELTALRVLHIVPGAFWVGAAVFVAFILQPVARKLGPQVEAPLFASLGKAMGPVMTVAGLLTIVFGLVLVDRTPGRGFDQLFASGWGVAIGVGLIAAVLAFILGLWTGMMAVRIGKVASGLAPGTPPPPDTMARIEPLNNQVRMLSRVHAALVIVAVATMASARFV